MKLLNTSQGNHLDSKNSTIEKNIDANNLDKSNKLNSIDDMSINSDQKIITNEINTKDTGEKEIESNKDFENSKNNKSKSNFI